MNVKIVSAALMWAIIAVTELRASSLSQATQGWTALQERYQQFAATVHVLHVDGTEERVIGEADVKFNRDWFVFCYTDNLATRHRADQSADEEEPDRGEPEEAQPPVDSATGEGMANRSRATAVNSEYSFEVRRIGLQSEWVISEMRAADSATRKRLMVRLRGSPAAWCPLDALSFCDGQSMLDLAERKDFTIDRECTDDSGKYVLEFHLDDPLNRFMTLKHGVVRCDPNNNFAILECQMQVSVEERPGTNTVEQVNRYDADGHLAESVIENDVGYHVIFRVDRLEFRDIPEAEFRLPAFGLPEIAHNTWGNRSWLLGAMVMCLGAGLWYIRRRRT